MSQFVLRSLLWLLLGAWIGAMAHFTLVALEAFRVLPDHALAGRMVEAVLTPLQYYGMAAGLGLAGIAWALGRGALRVALPALLASLCAISHFGVSARLDELRDRAFGAAPEAEAAAAFMSLHTLSMVLFYTGFLGALALLLLHVRSDLEARKSLQNP